MKNRNIICILWLISLLGCALYIPAILIGAQGDDSCSSTYEGIDFTYSTWLLWFGLGGLISLVLMTLAIIFEAIEETLGLISGLCFYILYVFWTLSWYFVGAILLFETLSNQDCHGHKLWIFGLVLFIIQTIYLCAHAATLNDPQ